VLSKIRPQLQFYGSMREKGQPLRGFPYRQFIIAAVVFVHKETAVSAYPQQIGPLPGYITGFGSAYYHWHPDNDRLVWDRVPMTIVFMSLLAATVAELVDRRLGMGLLFPIVAVGVASVLYWHWSELHGRGDLRWYGFVQFYPMVLIPLLIWLYWSPAHKPAIRSLAWVVAWYVVAKILEVPDRQIYDLIGISGHTLKHFAAAMSTAYFVQLFGRRYRRLGGEAIPGTNDRPGDRAA